MKRFALIGRHLGHSWSQLWFTDLFAHLGLEGYSYTLHEMPTLDGLRRWVEEEEISGFNVTIPYKQAIIPLLDEITHEAETIGAVNCVCASNGRLVGHNTDAPAFANTIKHSIAANDTALILGTGGAARAVGYAFAQMGIEHLHVSRHPEKHKHDNMKVIGYDHLPPSNLLVNATPVGMWPDVDSTPFPLPLSNFNFRLVYDLIYNPSPTLLLRQAAETGAVCMDGLAMLHRQAELSWKLWQ